MDDKIQEQSSTIGKSNTPTPDTSSPKAVQQWSGPVLSGFALMSVLGALMLTLLLEALCLRGSAVYEGYSSCQTR